MNEYAEGGFVKKNVEKGKDLIDKIEEYLFPGEVEIEGSGYERSILDRRIEKYLDDHFDEYIEEFGLVRELELEIHESRYESLKEDISDIKEFQMDMESDLESMKRRLQKLEE